MPITINVTKHIICGQARLRKGRVVCVLEDKQRICYHDWRGWGENRTPPNRMGCCEIMAHMIRHDDKAEQYYEIYDSETQTHKKMPGINPAVTADRRRWTIAERRRNS